MGASPAAASPRDGGIQPASTSLGRPPTRHAGAVATSRTRAALPQYFLAPRASPSASDARSRGTARARSAVVRPVPPCRARRRRSRRRRVRRAPASGRGSLRAGAAGRRSRARPHPAGTRAPRRAGRPVRDPRRPRSRPLRLHFPRGGGPRRPLRGRSRRRREVRAEPRLCLRAERPAAASRRAGSAGRIPRLAPERVAELVARDLTVPVRGEVDERKATLAARQCFLDPRTVDPHDKPAAELDPRLRQGLAKVTASESEDNRAVIRARRTRWAR